MLQNRFFRLFWSLPAALVLSSCAPELSLLTPQTTIAGEAVNSVRLRVHQPFTFRPALYSATYPAGLYVPRFEDANGVYFEAPSQLLMQTVAGGRTGFGGIYVSKGSWDLYQAYIDENGAIYKFDIPVDVELSLSREE